MNLTELDLRGKKVTRDRAKSFQEGKPGCYWIMLTGSDLWHPEKAGFR